MSKGSIHAELESVAVAEPEQPGPPGYGGAEQSAKAIPAALFGGLRMAELAALDAEKLALLATLSC
jgi:hypothetical protein